MSEIPNISHLELLVELIELVEVFVVVLVVVFLLGVVDEGGHAGVVGGGTVAVVGVGYADTAIAAVLIVVTLLKVLTRFLWHLRN